jgi:hypothetical protein
MGPLNIAKSRRYLSREEGGLGLFDIKIFWGAKNATGLKGQKIWMTFGSKDFFPKVLGTFLI